MIRPNITSIIRAGETLRVNGNTDSRDVADLVEIRVVLTQDDLASSGIVPKTPGDPWTAEVPDVGFSPGPVVAVGVEIHSKNATTITWSQALEIPPQA